MPTAFQIYWQRLKDDEPALYQSKLKQNRDRIKQIRAALYADKTKHSAYKQLQRARYATRRAKSQSNPPV